MNPAGSARNLRVGLLTAHLTRAGGGVFTSARGLARALCAQEGIEVEIFGPAEGGADLSGWDSLALDSATFSGPGAFAYANRLYPKIQAADIGLLHLHGLWMHTSVVSLEYSRRLGRPHIVSPHGMLDPWALRNAGWKKKIAGALFENANIQTAACLHALNTAEERAIRAFGYNGPVCTISNGVELPSQDAPEPVKPWWHRTTPDVRTLLYLGRLHPKKGLSNLLIAWSRLDKELQNGWRLIVAGWDERRYLLTLRRMAQALHIEATTIFPGPLFGDEKRAAFQYCDGFILPSFSEGLPMVLLEAWAYGKPALMTSHCNLPEGFEAGAALPIETNPESITAALEAFMTMDDAKRATMGANGTKLVSRRFTWPVVGAEMADVYRWLAASGPKPSTVST
jgi:glycosyltransferase involved in cell wall biosynthesis